MCIRDSTISCNWAVIVWVRNSDMKKDFMVSGSLREAFPTCLMTVSQLWFSNFYNLKIILGYFLCLKNKILYQNLTSTDDSTDDSFYYEEKHSKKKEIQIPALSVHVITASLLKEMPWGLPCLACDSNSINIPLE